MPDSVDSISATLARIVRLSVSRAAFARQATNSRVVEFRLAAGRGFILTAIDVALRLIVHNVEIVVRHTCPP